MSEITAVLLSFGESTRERALESLARQTCKVRDVIEIANESPFHRAFNLGAARVQTEFFLQLDADMVMDPGCLTALLSCMSQRCACSVGHLRDPLIGRVVGIKLWRTALVKSQVMTDSISPDTDCLDALERQGWQTVYPVLYGSLPPEHWHTFGLHDPAYAPGYTFRKYLLEGSRYRHRNFWQGLRWLIRQLMVSSHPSRDFALLGAAEGICRPLADDGLGPLKPDARVEGIRELLSQNEDPHASRCAMEATGPETYWEFYARGQAQPAAVKEHFQILSHLQERDAWLACLGYASGAMAHLQGLARVDESFCPERYLRGER